MTPFSYPPRARSGDRVAIVSPSGRAAAEFAAPVDLGLRRLRAEFGLEPVEYPTTRAAGGVPAGARGGPAWPRSPIRGIAGGAGHDRRRRRDHGAAATSSRGWSGRLPEAVRRLQRQHQPAELAVEPGRAPATTAGRRWCSWAGAARLHPGHVAGRCARLCIDGGWTWTLVPEPKVFNDSRAATGTTPECPRAASPPPGMTASEGWELASARSRTRGPGPSWGGCLEILRLAPPRRPLDLQPEQSDYDGCVLCCCETSRGDALGRTTSTRC